MCLVRMQRWTNLLLRMPHSNTLSYAVMSSQSVMPQLVTKGQMSHQAPGCRPCRIARYNQCLHHQLEQSLQHPGLQHRQPRKTHQQRKNMPVPEWLAYQAWQRRCRAGLRGDHQMKRSSCQPISPLVLTLPQTAFCTLVEGDDVSDVCAMEGEVNDF